MREIKFRGKDISTGEWRYGSYIYQPVFASAFPQDGRTPPKETATRIYMPETFESDPKICSVDPASVGQYTGLRDKNGVEIYEGDILRTMHGVYEVVFESGAYRIKKGSLRFILVDGSCYEAVGNVHDAPELMKK